MVSLFGPSEQDLERLRATVQSLGTTSVPGLAAALSWRERKAEKLLAHELARADSPIVYEPARRVVRWARIPLPVPAPTEVPAEAPAVVPAIAPRAPAPVLAGGSLKTLCPSCHVALIPTGSASLAVCPQCGRLSSPHTPGMEMTLPASTSISSASTPVVATASDLPDRRSQEMFAAYVASKPIPCPKCRTTLRHRGLSEYICPNCAQVVRFPKSAETPAAATLPPAPPA
jgi:predicted RNA-binding Zn-ribbon protein involved in translation (DUF1610 family)